MAEGRSIKYIMSLSMVAVRIAFSERWALQVTPMAHRDIEDPNTDSNLKLLWWFFEQDEEFKKTAEMVRDGKLTEYTPQMVKRFLTTMRAWMLKLRIAIEDAYLEKVIKLANEKLQPPSELKSDLDLAKLLANLVANAIDHGSAGFGDWTIDELYSLIHEIMFMTNEVEGDSGWRQEVFAGFLNDHANGTYLYELTSNNALFSKVLSRAVERARAKVMRKVTKVVKFNKTMKNPGPLTMQVQLKEGTRSNFYATYTDVKWKNMHVKYRGASPRQRKIISLTTLIHSNIQDLTSHLVAHPKPGLDPHLEVACHLVEKCMNDTLKPLLRDAIVFEQAPAQARTQAQTQAQTQAPAQAPAPALARQVPLNSSQHHRDSTRNSYSHHPCHNRRVQNSGNDNENEARELQDQAHLRDTNQVEQSPAEASSPSHQQVESRASGSSRQQNQESQVETGETGGGIFGKDASIVFQEDKASATSKRGAQSDTATASASENSLHPKKKAKRNDNAAAAAGARGSASGDENTPDVPVEHDGTGVYTAAAAAAAAAAAEETVGAAKSTGEEHGGPDDAAGRTETDDESTTDGRNSVEWWVYCMAKKGESKKKCDTNRCKKAAIATWMSSDGDFWNGCKACTDKEPENGGFGGMPENPIEDAEGPIDLENIYVASIKTKYKYHRMGCANANCKHHICLECHGVLLRSKINGSSVSKCGNDHDVSSSYKDVTGQAYFKVSQLQKDTENGQCSRCGLYFHTKSFFDAKKKKEEEEAELGLV